MQSPIDLYFLDQFYWWMITPLFNMCYCVCNSCSHVSRTRQAWQVPYRVCNSWSAEKSRTRKHYQQIVSETSGYIPHLWYYSNKSRRVWKLPPAQNWAWLAVASISRCHGYGVKWRQIHQKSAMFLASAVWLKKDWRAFSRYSKAQWLPPPPI